MKVALVQVVEELLESRLKEASLWKFVHLEQSQFLDLEEEVFVELVLTDGSALNEVEKIVRHTRAELKTKGIELDSVVRALWEVVDVKYVDLSRTSEGIPRTAHEFRGTLKSGTREVQVTVDVSEVAEDLLREKLGGKVDGDSTAQVVSNFLRWLLSHGGTSYWDPLLDSRLDLDGTAMSFLLGYGPAFEDLRQAITDAFEPPAVSSFLADLSRAGIRIRDFDAVLPPLFAFSGGSDQKGRRISANATDLFASLQRAGQELLRQYFHSKVGKLENRWPELKEEFPQVFS